MWNLILLVFIALTCQGASVVRVPFVGCKSDGQTGPVDSPHEADKVVEIDASAAQRLAYYSAEGGPGVLAPRGWYCSGAYGSSGATLFVTPEPIEEYDLSFAVGSGIAGPAIQLGYIDGGTSGRFTVAGVIARVFPVYKAFVRSVIEEGISTASDYPFGPYPNDKLTYHGDRTVEFQTPAHSEGLGTMSRLTMNDYPISGVAILRGNTPDLLLLTARLRSDLNDLTPLIIRQVERDNAGTKTPRQ